MSSAGEDGIQHQVGEHIERRRDVLIEHLDVETDGLLAGEGVEVAADGVDFAGDELGAARLGSFEDHVFDEVRDAVDFGELMA